MFGVNLIQGDGERNMSKSFKINNNVVSTDPPSHVFCDCGSVLVTSFTSSHLKCNACENVYDIHLIKSSYQFVKERWDYT